MKKYLFALSLLFILSCKREAQEVTQNGDFKVEFLFEKDGCKMYRFYDGRTVYWANCQGKVNSDYETHSKSGKTNTTYYHRVEAITTKH